MDVADGARECSVLSTFLGSATDQERIRGARIGPLRPIRAHGQGSVPGYQATAAPTFDEHLVTPTVPSSRSSVPFMAMRAARCPPADSPQTPMASPLTPTLAPN